MALDLDDDDDILATKAKKNAGEETKYVIPENAPVLPSIISGERDAELVVNIDSQAAILYNKPLPEDIEWVEYDIDLSMLTFVTNTGKVQGFGMKVHKPFRKYLSKADEIMLIYMQDSKIPVSFVPVKMVVRYTGL